jgi:hypothetical protein
VHCRSACLLLAVAALFLSPAVFAAPRDSAANQKIEEAINTLYLATEFDKAEALLKGVLEACEDRCSPQIKARAWMYVGIVRGSGKQDIAGAQDAFQQALALDPNVKLDDALATPAVRQAFSSAAAALGQAAPPSKGSKLPETQAGGGGGGAVPGNMECTPNVKQVEMQRPIPVACTTDEPATKVTLRYKAFGSETWQQVAMTKKGEYWQSEIPCAETGVAGKMRFYVQAKDKDGEELDNYGTKKEPAEISIVSRTDEEPPSYPGQAAPQKCMEKSSCPPEMLGTPACPGTGGGAARGNKGWGSPCDASQECDVGLLCTQGDNGRTCETAPSCDSGADCPAGAICKSGTCDIDEASGGEAAGPFKKNWIGLHMAFDFAYLSGSSVCGTPSDFNCYFGGGTPYTNRNGFPASKYSGNINGGFATGTIRLLASYERILVGNLGAEARLGFAFNGGPKTPQGQAFLPVHAEVRGKYWFGKNVFAKKGLRPYVHLGGGLAQVDVRLPTTVVDCRTNPANVPLTDDDRRACQFGRAAEGPTQQFPNGRPAVASGSGGKQVTLDAYRKLGQGFVTIGGGAMYAFGKNHGLVLNVSLMYMLPSSGVVFEPSLGYVLGL